MLNPEDFTFYDIANFPIVSIQGSLLPAGYAPQWIMEMETLVANAEPFVFIFLDNAQNPVHEDQKAQMKWLKAHKKALAKLCKGIVAVEPDRTTRMLKRAQAMALTAAFGLHMWIVPDPHQAEMRARRVFTGEAIPEDTE